MARISPDQKLFLKRQGVPLSKVFDAEGWKTAAYKAEMKVLDHWIAIGVTPCRESGHTMRTRSGHCPQCNPKQLGYLIRYDKDGQVYVLSSASTGYIKIGSSNAAESIRVASLNRECYGNASDWAIELLLSCEHANRAEVEAHRLLAKHKVSAPYPQYLKNGKWTDCRELFSCDLTEAYDAVITSVAEHGGEWVETEETFEAPEIVAESRKESSDCQYQDTVLELHRLDAIKEAERVAAQVKAEADALAARKRADAIKEAERVAAQVKAEEERRQQIDVVASTQAKPNVEPKAEGSNSRVTSVHDSNGVLALHSEGFQVEQRLETIHREYAALSQEISTLEKLANPPKAPFWVSVYSPAPIGWIVYLTALLNIGGSPQITLICLALIFASWIFSQGYRRQLGEHQVCCLKLKELQSSLLTMEAESILVKRKLDTIRARLFPQKPYSRDYFDV